MSVAKLRNCKNYVPYYKIADSYNLNQFDQNVIQYFIEHIQLSVGRGVFGKNGKIFFRYDNKLHGFFWATHMNSKNKLNLYEDMHGKAGKTAMENSLNRLQFKYHLIYRHHSNNYLQIYLPFMDKVIQEYLNDKNYHTYVNKDIFQHDYSHLNKRFKNKINKVEYQKIKAWKEKLSKYSDTKLQCMEKTNINVCKNQTSMFGKCKHRSLENANINNSQINNSPITNSQRVNCFYINNAKNKFFGVIKNKHESLGLTINSLKAISGFSQNYKEFSSIINKLFTVTNYNHNSKLKEYKKSGLFIDKKLRNFGTSPYFTSNVFINDLSNVFGQIDYNTNHNSKKPDRKEYGGYLVSTLTERMVYYLKKHKYIEVTRKSNKKNKKTDKKATRDPNLIIKRDAKGNIKYCKQIPKWAKNGYHEKLHPTSKKMQRKLQRQLHDLNEPQHNSEPKQHKHGFGNPVDINTGKSIDTQDNSRDANELKSNTPKKSPSKQSNNKSNINTQSDTKMNDKSTHVKNKDTAVGRKSRLSELRNEYNQIATKKFKECYSKMVNGKVTDAERKFCINKSKELNPISNEIQKIERQIKKDKANAIPNTADNSNDSSDEDLPF